MATSTDESSDAYTERVLATAVRRLARKGHPDISTALLECTLRFELENQDWGIDYSVVIVSTPEQTYDDLTSDLAKQQLESLFSELAPHDERWRHQVQMRLDDVEKGWREAAYASLGKAERNQGGLVFQGQHIYNGLRYKSYSEVMLAKELDSRGVLFFPLPAASRGGVLREPDFLIISKGRAGIVEVHGEPYHPASRAAEDHKRNLLFEESGVRVLVFDARELRQNPKLVADKFLQLLAGPTR